MITDDRKIITGSFNFTNAANERNAENLVMINDPALALRYKDYWIKRMMLAKPLTALSADTESMVKRKRQRRYTNLITSNLLARNEV